MPKKEIPSGCDEDGVPIDDAVDFALGIRQERIRKRNEGKRMMEQAKNQINRDYQQYRDQMKWVDERTRKPL